MKTLIENERSFVLNKIKCSEQAVQKLDAYVALLSEWQKKMNLVADSTIPVVWTRHVWDSAQLINYLKKTDKKIVDFGSGAGFPALVLAILCPEIEFHLIESDMKKTDFLKTVVENLQLKNVFIHWERIEKIHINQIDVITARALASLEKLFVYVLPYMNNKTRCLFLKGKKAFQEIESAQKKFRFLFHHYQSLTSEEGRVLEISEIFKK